MLEKCKKSKGEKSNEWKNKKQRSVKEKRNLKWESENNEK